MPSGRAPPSAVTVTRYRRLVKSLTVGKRLPGAVYLHVDALGLVPTRLMQMVRRWLPPSATVNEFNVWKFDRRVPRLSLLSYPGFADTPHPVLRRAQMTDLVTGRTEARDFSRRRNPPILHRKEAFLPPMHADVPRFTALTHEEELAGLYDTGAPIGHREAWERLLAERGLSYDGHRLVRSRPEEAGNPAGKPVPRPCRHRTAIRRTTLSRPVQLVLEAGLLTRDDGLFDYGCGRGDDVAFLRGMGYQADGWDPAHAPEAQRRPADVVNLGYVVNVIEEPAERAAVLRQAWELSRRLLVVAARLTGEADGLVGKELGDGCLTGRDTFQRFYTQQELRGWIEQTLGVPAVAGAPGVFLVFRDEVLEQRFLLTRQRHRTAPPQIRRSEALFAEHEQLLVPLMEFYARHGRLPALTERGSFEAVGTALGSLGHAFHLIRRVTGEERWEQARAACAEDLLVYLALTRFGRRPTWHALPDELRLDIRAHFGTYKRACEAADRALFALGRIEALDAACREAPFGKLTDSALYVHVAGVAELPMRLRLYEGCARAYVGEVEAATVAKLHRYKPQVTYLHCPQFDQDPHPPVLGSLVVPLQTLDVQYRDFRGEANPMILHRKEQYVPATYPLRERFARLTAQEERAGLLAAPEAIATKADWDRLLAERGLAVRGHRLVRTAARGTPATP